MARFKLPNIRIKDRIKALGDSIDDAADDVKAFAGRYYTKAKNKLHNLTGRTREQKELEVLIETGENVGELLDNIEDFQQDVVEGLQEVEDAVKSGSDTVRSGLRDVTEAITGVNKLLKVQLILTGLLLASAVAAIVLALV